MLDLSRIDPHSEYQVNPLAKLIGVHQNSLHRWRFEGIVRDGARVKLPTVKRAGRRYVSGQALLDYLSDPESRMEPRSAAARNRTCDAALRELEAVGVG